MKLQRAQLNYVDHPVRDMGTDLCRNMQIFDAALHTVTKTAFADFVKFEVEFL